LFRRFYPIPCEDHPLQGRESSETIEAGEGEGYGENLPAFLPYMGKAPHPFHPAVDGLLGS